MLKFVFFVAIFFIAFVLSLPACADQCMFKATTASYISAKHVAVVQLWDDNTVIFKGAMDRHLVTVHFDDPVKARAYINQMVVRINQCN